MKKRFVLRVMFLTFLFQATVMGQDINVCKQDLSIFAEFAKVKNYKSAYQPWLNVRTSCPSINVAVFSYGERILKDLIKNGTPEEVAASKLDIIKLYGEWIEYFPKRRNNSIVGDVLSKKAQALLDYEIGNLKEVYDTFNEAYQKDPASFTNPQLLYNYFKTYYDRYKAGDQEVTMELLINKYEEVSEKFDIEGTALAKKLDVILKKEEEGTALSSRENRNKRVYNVNSNAIGTFLSNLDAIIAQEATCKNLIPLYQRNFDENKGNIVWLKRAASRMDSKECSDDSFFVTLVEALHSLDPSADSAYYLGLLNNKRGNTSEALKYYEESIALEEDNYRKAKILMKIANKFEITGRKSSARSYANKALSFQPSLGRAYLLIARLYADSANQCGDSQFNKRAVYWLAADIARKAGQVDASLKKVSIKTVESYIGRAPSKTDIFTEGNQGTKVVFNCWINNSIKVPSL
ncbi:MAG: tetratricopeptide (TPR) repeat protein [Flavobacteriaceae bacterium]|jgi:tetratricopeptide (TPR) repeat protein|tara:strand:- start:2107 stop:3498 length:1392 start_codon:yes stop_codon:yes gene_type:complete